VSPKLLRKLAAKGEEDEEKSPDPAAMNSHNRFRDLARRLLRVPIEDVREAERRYAESRSGQKVK